MNEMNFHRADAISRMESLRSVLRTLPQSAGKQLLMSTMEDYRMELMNDMSERETQQKHTAAHLLKDLQNIETERHSVRERKQKAWGRIMLNGIPHSKWDLTVDWLTMTNALFFEKYSFNWTPSIALQNDVKGYFKVYGNISEDDLKKPYGAIGETKAPLPLEVIQICGTNTHRNKELINALAEAYKWTEENKEMKYPEEIEGDKLLEIIAADEYIGKRAVRELTRNQLNTLGGLNSPGYKMTT